MLWNAVQVNPSATELTTATTDALLGILCLLLMARLRACPTEARWKKAVWTWVFVLMVAASGAGTIVHGFDLPDPINRLLWQPLYLSLGLAVALFVVGAVADWRGHDASRQWLPWAAAGGVGFWLLSLLWGGAFIVFVGYEAIAMVAALSVYVFLAFSRRAAGASMVSAGIGLTLIAAAIQASHLSLRVIVPFDHNGLFHVVQMIATMTIAVGIRRELESEPERPVR